MRGGWAFPVGQKRALPFRGFFRFYPASGIALFISFVRAPSESSQQILFGLSITRLIVAGIFSSLIAVSIFTAFLFSGKHRERLEQKLRASISNRFGFVLGCVYALAFVTTASVLLMIPPLPVSLRLLEPIRARLLDPLIWSLISSVSLAVLLRWFYADLAHEDTTRKLDRALLLGSIFIATFLFYEHFAALIGWVNKVKYSYWNLLAGEFLQGRLYLSNPPANTHDLTLYNDRWYVPSPPIPAVMMMPLVWFFGAENISTADFSMIFCAMNAVLVFLILEQCINRGWIKITPRAALWFVVIFVAGTPHLWVGISGRFWFVSQILTVTFIALAVLGALNSWSPWLLGILIGLAVGTRPNGLMTLPFLLAISAQIWKDRGEPVDLKRLVGWAIPAAIPVGFAIAALLVYNYARFEDFSDFGYVTINGDAVIVQNAQTYGMFSPHYILYNLKVMFFYLPDFRPGERWFLLPSGAGMSIFLTTPALLYLFHRYENRLWVWGAWAAVVLNFALLVLYHNTGKDQFGYRYILDALIPLTILLAARFEKKLPWHFILLIILSVVINLYGANWFMNG